MTEKYARCCGLPEYKGEKNPFPPIFKIRFGKKIIRECPNSYCDWEYVGDAVHAYQYYDKGYLPEVWDEQRNCQASILDQTEFFHIASGIVGNVINQAEKRAHDEAMKKVK